MQGEKTTVMLGILKILVSTVAEIVWIYIWLGPSSILKVGRSKSGYKKLIKSISWSDKLLRRNYVRLSKTAVKLQVFFVIMTYIFYILVLLLIILLILSAFFPEVSNLLPYYFILKGGIIEIPALIVVYCNMYRKDRGLGWKFEKSYTHRNRRQAE